jgi:hypothetical protein
VSVAVKITARIFQADPEDVDMASALDALQNLDPQARTVPQALGNRLFSMPDLASVGLGLWTLRPGAGLDIFDGNDIRPWDLPTDLAEGSFFRFFDDGTVVMLLKGHGPRTTALSKYLEDVTGLDVLFNAVVAIRDRRYITHLDDVKRVEMTFSNEAVEELRQVDEGLGNAAASLITTSSSDKLTVIFDGSDSDSREAMWGQSRGWISRLSAAAPFFGLGRLRVVVRGEIDGEEQVDLLKDRITYQMEVPAQGHLDLPGAMDVATRAYTRYRDEFG